MIFKIKRKELQVGTYSVLALVGGISKGSNNKKLYRAVLELRPKELEFESFDISQLPFFSQDIENDPPEVVKKLKEAIKTHSAILFVTPEYNRSMPGVLKNAIDWGSRPFGKGVWDRKITAVMGTSTGNTGAMSAQLQLRQTLLYLNTYVMGQPEFYSNANKMFDKEGRLVDEKSKEHIEKFLQTLVGWIKEHSHRNS